MVEVLVHEGSHHAPADLTDEEWPPGEGAYGRRDCADLASKKPESALKNADNFCYYVQDVADQVASTDGSGKKVTVPVVEDTFSEGEDMDTAEDASEEAYDGAENVSENDWTCVRSGPTGMKPYIKND